KKMSKGMKQKLALIAAVMHKPKVLILDEPTSGLDPVMQKQFKKLLEKLIDKFNTTILLCSHYFDELANLANKVIVMNKGLIIRELDMSKNTAKDLGQVFDDIFNLEVDF